MRYTKFEISNYKAVSKIAIDLSTEGLVLLLGVNESGKTSILRAIESFDVANDPAGEIEQVRFFESIRNKSENSSVATITATITLDKQDIEKLLLNAPHYADKLTNVKKTQISRNFTFDTTKFVNYKYTIDSETKSVLSIGDDEEQGFCMQILALTPSIQYFEDFKDQIPDYISTHEGQEHYDSDWNSVIEGMFYDADPEMTIQQFEEITDENNRQTILNKINKALDKKFTTSWNKKLKGIRTIHEAKLVFDWEKKLFTFTIIGSDKVTVFRVEERSKGALWYFTFLLKTEFRKKKLRAQHGKTLYLIDEPGSNLHSSAQETMIEDFKRLASDSNVIYTTHSQYLIDKPNVSNTYIVEYNRHKIKATKYKQYIQGKNMKLTYFQPLLDALQIRPFALTINWDRALLVEGIYDWLAYRTIFNDVLKIPRNFVIMPGTSASSLVNLISLHIGWGADLVVLLDNDREGRKQAKRYKRLFPNLVNNIVTLDLPGAAENMFTDQAKKSILKLAELSGTKINKSTFNEAFRIVATNNALLEKLPKLIDKTTRSNFETEYKKVYGILKNF